MPFHVRREWNHQGRDAVNQNDGIEWGVIDAVGHIVLNRPEQANTLSRGLAKALVLAINDVIDAAPRVILLSARGKYFSGGGNIDEMVAAGDRFDDLVDEILAVVHPAIQRLATCPIPVVTALNGPVAGGGIGLALCADFVLGGASAKLRGGYAAIGLSPDVGGSYFLARRVGALRAQQWYMSNETIDAERCLATGVIDSLHADDALDAAVNDLVGRLVKAAPGSMAAIKQLCSGLPGRSLADHLHLEHELLRARTRSGDGKEGVRAFIEKRAAQFTGA